MKSTTEQLEQRLVQANKDIDTICLQRDNYGVRVHELQAIIEDLKIDACDQNQVIRELREDLIAALDEVLRMNRLLKEMYQAEKNRLETQEP